jgi:hypothetical protein
MVLEALVASGLVVVLAFVMSALPLYFSVKFLGGKPSLLKTIFVTFISGIIVSAIKHQFKIIGGLLALFVLIWIYHEVFKLRWWKAFIAWILQFVFLVLIYVVLALVAAAWIGINLVI